MIKVQENWMFPLKAQLVLEGPGVVTINKVNGEGYASTLISAEDAEALAQQLLDMAQEMRSQKENYLKESAEVDKLMAEGDKLRARGELLRIKGSRLIRQGEKLRFNR